MKPNIGLLLFFFYLSAVFSLQAQKKAERNGWKLAIQAYSFKEYTVVESIEKARSLGLKYIELYHNQHLGKGFGKDAKTDFPEMDDETIKKIRKILKENGLKVIAIGVFTPKGKEEWIRTFEVARKLGAEVINSEPQPSDIPMIDRLASGHKIKVALHNHPKKLQGTPYWDPQVAFDAIKSSGPYIGICGDIKQWIRSGFDPLDCVRLLEGRFFSFHFNDVNARDPDAHDVPWGAGTGEVRQILEELHRQRFKGIFSIEYAHNWTSSLPEIKESIRYFDQVTTEIFQR